MAIQIEHSYQPAKNTNKQTIVFCHGYAANYHYHDGFSNQLSDHDYYAVILPGHGQAYNVTRDEMKVSYYGKLLADWILQKKLTRIILMGHSMGGAVVATACKYLPKDVVSKLILIAPMNEASIAKGLVFLTKFRPTRLAKGKHLTRFNKILYFNRESIYENPVNGAELLSKELEYYNARLAGFKHLHKSMSTMKEMRQIVDAYRSLNVPTYLIVGEDDGILPSNLTIKKLKKLIPDLIAIKMLRTGHLLFEERPVDYFKVVSDIIEDKKIQSLY